MTELKEHIQQMAEKFDKKDEAADTIESPSEFVIRIYKQGIKDADAIGFAEWLETRYFQSVGGSWQSKGIDTELYPTEELYLIYLKQKQ